MNLLTRDQILSANDLKTEVVAVPEWGGEVQIRSLTALERATLESVGVGDWAGWKMQFVVRSIVGEDGQPIFTTADGEALMAKSATAFARVWKAVETLNGLSNAAVDEAEKGSAVAQADGSISNSPGDSDTPIPT